MKLTRSRPSALRVTSTALLSCSTLTSVMLHARRVCANSGVAQASSAAKQTRASGRRSVITGLLARQQALARHLILALARHLILEALVLTLGEEALDDRRLLSFGEVAGL